MILLFSVHCSKKKPSGLGLGILALAGGGGGSSSSSSDNPKKKPDDDSNNDPKFEEVKKKIESTIKFPSANENKIINDFKSVDFSITGDFFQELGKHPKLQLQHQVSAGSKKTTEKTIEITKKFITDKKIPLKIDLSSLQSDTGFVQPKLKLKFSSDGKQIIQKEWEQTLYLEGKKQIPSLSYTNKSNKEVQFTKPVIYDSLNNSFLIKVKVPDNLGLSDKFQTRIKAKSLPWSSGAHNRTFSPTFTTPDPEDGFQNFKDLPVRKERNYTIASQLFYRLKGKPNQSWSSTPLFTNYYYFTNKDTKYEIQVNQFLFKKREKLTLRFTIPDDYTNVKVKGMVISLGALPKTIYTISPTGAGKEFDTNQALMEQYLTVDYKSQNKALNEKEDYTLIFDFKNNIKQTITMGMQLKANTGSGLFDIDHTFKIRLETEN